jgi:hypothetical protein
LEDKDWKPKRNPKNKLIEDTGMVLTALTLLMFVIGTVMMLAKVGGSIGASIFFIGVIMSFILNIFWSD